MAAPDRPAISAWLSLVGIPNHQAATAHMTMANRAAHNATKASWVFPLKSTISYTVVATLALIIVISSTPRKLKTAAMRIAARGDMQRVETQVAMAFGASVQPLTKITPRVSRTVMSSVGLENSWVKNSLKDMVAARAGMTSD